MTTFHEALEELQDRMALAADQQHWPLYFELKEELTALCSVMRREP